MRASELKLFSNRHNDVRQNVEEIKTFLVPQKRGSLKTKKKKSR